MIWKNFFRELTHTMSRLVSVIVIAAVAVLLHLGLSGLVYNVDLMVNNYFSQQNIASYWISGIGFDRIDCKKLQKIESVEQVQPQIVLDAEDRYNEDTTLTLYGVADGYAINTPFILEGAFPKNNRGIMISSSFAQKHGLRIGDFYELKIKATGKIVKKQICAFIKDPERINHINATTILPDFYSYGFAYMNDSAISEVLGKNLYNQICIKTNGWVSDAEIKREINKAIGNKVISVVALNDNTAAYSLLEQVNSIKSIIMLFPLIFFLVAVLIMFSTMSRLIENARLSIGTLKALGYSDGTVLIYYMLSPMLVVLAGFIIGVIPSGLITKSIFGLLTAGLDLPAYQLLPDVSAWALSFGLTCVFCVGTALIVAARALNEKPADCMRPKPPKQTKKVIFEKIPFLWKVLSFSQKYIIRNMLRNKMRMLICVVGVAGCTALILTALSLSDSVTNFTQMLANNAHRYDVYLSFDPTVTKMQYLHLKKMDTVTDVQYEMQTNVKIYSSDKQETTLFTVTDDSIHLKLIDTFGPSEFALPKHGIILEKSIADKLGFRLGDIATFKFADKKMHYGLPIEQIQPGIKGVYASQSYWRSLGKGFSPTSAYVKTTNPDAFMEKISDFDFVTSFKTKQAITDAIKSKTESLSTIVIVVTVFGGILALVVLYNLGIMSFYEQIRNLATLMVLGFYDKETRKLLLTENVVFTTFGIILGVPLGISLCSGLMSSITMFYMKLSIQPLSYVVSAAITMGFVIIVNALIGRKMKTIDMLGALKSLE